MSTAESAARVQLQNIIGGDAVVSAGELLSKLDELESAMHSKMVDNRVNLFPLFAAVERSAKELVILTDKLRHYWSESGYEA